MLTLVANPDVLRAGGIAQVSGRMNGRGPGLAEALFAGIPLPPQLRGAVLSRQLEFLAGRWCAGGALRAINPGWTDEVGIGADGAPCWPSGIVGSITHTADFVWAAAALRRDVGAIGVDSEAIMTAERARRLAPRIACRQEIARACDALKLDAATATTLLFSAKEALFKSLSAHLGRPFDYLDARVDISREPASFCARLHPRFCDDLPAGLTLSGRFEVGATHVHTGVTLSARESASRRVRS